jgi:hypothetical protein
MPSGRATSRRHGAQCVDAPLIEQGLPGVYGPPSNAEPVRCLCRALARQQHLTRPQAPPLCLVQSLSDLVLHPMHDKCRYNA